MGERPFPVGSGQFDQALQVAAVYFGPCFGVDIQLVDSVDRLADQQAAALGSNGASVAKSEWSGPKNSRPQAAAAVEPLVAVSA